MFAEVKAYTEKYNITLVAVTKTRNSEEIMNLYRQGQRHMGENRVQELMTKKDSLPQDIKWHLIGHLQSNKVKYIASFIHLIHSLDSLDLYNAIQKEAIKNDRTLDVLLQFHVATEETKFGLSYEEAMELVNYHIKLQGTRVRIKGVMGMASLTNDQVQIRKEMATLKGYFDRLKNEFFREDDAFREISMGMSSDYRIAAEEGSTMVRVGSLLFS